MVKSLSCPYCKSIMRVTEAHCDNCNVTIRGDFEIDRLSVLSPEQLEFAVNFLGHRGNLKELEKIYDLSYPTLRSRLNEIAKLISGDELDDEKEESDYDVLTLLNEGELTVDEALSKLKGEKNE